MTTAHHGTIALVGAGEFLPPMLPVDKYLVERLIETPRVAIVPTASAPDGGDVPARWAKLGVEHFAQLGVAVEPVMLLDHADANDTGIVSQLAAANFVYFSGGKPRYLLETLQGTAAWQTILDMFARGGIIAGCSAGAMALGAALFIEQTDKRQRRKDADEPDRQFDRSRHRNLLRRKAIMSRRLHVRSRMPASAYQQVIQGGV